MSGKYEASRVEKAAYFGIRRTTRGRGRRKPFVIGFDTEADDSRPFLIQFSEQGMDEHDTIVRTMVTDDNAGLRTFMEYICARLLGRFGRQHEVIMYGFNLAYEWTQLWHDIQVVAQYDNPIVTIDFEYGGQVHEFVWTIYNDKRTFAKLQIPAQHLTIRILDARMYYKTSLDNAAKMLGLGAKYEIESLACTTPGAWHESGHSRDHIDRSLADDPEFLTYARRDAYITRLIGEEITSLHDEYDVPQTISAPHFASSVFRHQFLTTEILLPQEDLEQAGLWSYHGGKNGFYLPGPAHLDGVYQYDITSAYPEAMRQLPDPEQAEWKRITTGYEPGRHALYVVTLDYTRCPWRGMLNHQGDWPMSGRIENICITSYELDAMVERNEVRIIDCTGWEMIGPSGGALERYVDIFFAQKVKTTGAARENAKLMLNSLYGKFFQKVALGIVGYYDFDADEIIERNPDGDFDYKAGGLYHPPIASLITGFVRAKIHGMEHKYRAIMTSTDGMFAYDPPDPADLGAHLGGLTSEHGNLDIWRERLYVFRSPDLEKPKIAYHGFFGTRDELEALPLATGMYNYTHRHMVTLKESLTKIEGKYWEPGSFIERHRNIIL